MFSSWGWRKWDDILNFGRFWSGIKCLYIKHFTCPSFYPSHCCCNQLPEGVTWQSFGSGASSTSGFLSKGFSEMLEGTHFFKHSLEFWVSLHPMRQILTNGNESKWLSVSFFIPMMDNLECIPWVPQGCWQNKTPVTHLRDKINSRVFLSLFRSPLSPTLLPSYHFPI